MIKVLPSTINGIIDAIPSKSVAHRVLFLASLSDKPTVINGVSTGEDTETTVSVLNALGARITETNYGYYVCPITTVNSGLNLNVNESGSTLRFLLPLIAVLGADCSISGKGRISSRPNVELINTLRNAGVDCSSDTLPLKMSGKLSAREISVRADISSQFVSGLLMSLQYLPYPTVLRTIGELKSKNYVDITVDCMRSFGAEVEIIENSYKLSGGGYRSPNNYDVEGDWSNSAFWLVAGAISGDVTVNNLNLDSLQGDKAIIEILKKANADVTIKNNAVRVKKSRLKPFDYDMENVPDLVPVTAVLATQTNGSCTLSSVDRLRYKESDRIQTTLDLLTNQGATAYYDANGLHVDGGFETDKFATLPVIDGANDHRIVMSACISAVVTRNGLSVTDENAVRKSYERFYEDYKSLGGIIENA